MLQRLSWWCPRPSIHHSDCLRLGYLLLFNLFLFFYRVFLNLSPIKLIYFVVVLRVKWLDVEFQIMFVVWPHELLMHHLMDFLFVRELFVVLEQNSIAVDVLNVFLTFFGLLFNLETLFLALERWHQGEAFDRRDFDFLYLFLLFTLDWLLLILLFCTLYLWLFFNFVFFLFYFKIYLFYILLYRLRLYWWLYLHFSFF
jgi:hypothetical protein